MMGSSVRTLHQEAEADYGDLFQAASATALAHAAGDINHMENRYALGGWIGCIPELGVRRWPSDAALQGGHTPFRCALYGMPEGPRVAFLRFGHFNQEDQALDWLVDVMPMFQSDADIMVVDLMHHIGGSLRQVYECLSLLTDRPLQVPKHEICITEELFERAQAVMSRADRRDPEDPRGPPSKEARRFAEFILAETGAGRARFRSEPADAVNSLPGYVYGIEEIAPADRPYAKPLLVVVDEATFSAGEFFAAIVQDNRRGRIFGHTTAGAGGLMRRYEPDDLGKSFGLDHYTLTWTVAHRSAGGLIEGVGVTPDVPYTQTVNDIIKDDVDRRAGIAREILGMLA